MAVDRTCVQSFIAVGAVEVRESLITSVITHRLAVAVTQPAFINLINDRTSSSEFNAMDVLWQWIEQVCKVS